MSQAAKPAWNTTLINPQNSQLVLIDYQPQMAFGVQSHDRQAIINNATVLAKSAKLFEVPVILTSVETEAFSGYFFPQILDVFTDGKDSKKGIDVLERSSMNTWDDSRIVEKIRKASQAGRKKVVFAGLWSEVCIVFPVLEALKDGHEVYFVSDACGGTSKEGHEMAVQRMVQAGAVPLTTTQYLLELQRDWARREKYNGVMTIVKDHLGAYGLGVEYAYTMVHKAPQSKAPQLVLKNNAGGAEKPAGH